MTVVRDAGVTNGTPNGECRVIDAPAGLIADALASGTWSAVASGLEALLRARQSANVAHDAYAAAWLPKGRRGTLLTDRD